MRPAFALAVGFLILATVSTRDDDAITPETVATIKEAAVYIRVEGDGWSGSGSGFVVAADKERVLVVTNHHVAVRLPPNAKPKPPAVSVVFNSGTKKEQEFPATVVGADEERDLAILRVVGLKNPPKPISFVDLPKPVETMGVFSFGFPFGQNLSVRKGFPAVTVGKASVSSLRNGDDGELAVIQIDGNLNPGNSGGPVVDSSGRLVGVAVSRIRNGQGIGFLIPAAEVDRLMAGRLGRVRVVAGKGTDGKPNARIEAELVDPASVFRTATAYCVIVPPKGKTPDPVALDKHPDVRKFALKVEKGVAIGELAIEKAEGTLVVQVVCDRGTEAKPLGSRPRTFSLAPAKTEDFAGTPPSPWKEYAWPGKFVIWLPEKPVQQRDDIRTVSLAGKNVQAKGVIGEINGLTYRAEVMESSSIEQFGESVHPAFRNLLRDETKGRITDTADAKSGSLSGNEYRVEAGSEVTRVRMFHEGARIYWVRVTGSGDRVISADAETILASFRRPGDVQGKTPAPMATEPKTPTTPKVIARGNDPTILGSIAHDPKFKTVGPEGAILIGLEVRFAKFGSTQIARAVRPIYRIDGEEELGRQFGRDLKGAVTLKAKDGYAVGGITGKAGAWCNGFALTFMKVKPDGTLDPKDSYESAWAGFDGKSEVIKIVGDGTPVVGIVGKFVGTETTALGLLFKGQEKFDAGADGAAVNPKVTAAGTEAVVIAGGPHPAFRAPGPDGAVLIGLELSIEAAFHEDCINGVRPIYRVTRDGKTEIRFGEHSGAREDRRVTLKAKPGYAVGAMTYKYSRDFDGCLLTFMKVKDDGTLDPKDRYDSEWIGWKGQASEGRIDGEGKPVVGIVGRGTAKDLNGFGLLFKGQTFDTNAAGKR